MTFQDKQKNDTDTFREILQYIHEYSMTSVLAVVWCVTPQVRILQYIHEYSMTSVLAVVWCVTPQARSLQYIH